MRKQKLKGGNNKQTYLSKLSKATRKFDKI